MITQYAGAVLLGAVILPVVAQKVDTRECETVVHVTETGVDVWIDGMAYRVEDLHDSPIVCDLRPGRHTLRMARNGRLLYEEEFTLRTDRDSVLTAWDRAKLNEAPSDEARPGVVPPPSGLLAETVGSFDFPLPSDPAQVSREGDADASGEFGRAPIAGDAKPPSDLACGNTMP